MRTLNVNYQSKEVRIFLENNLTDNLKPYLTDDKKYFILTDSNVASLYLNKVMMQIPQSTYYIMPSGETSKNFGETEKVIRKMLEANINKGDFLIALGGGVVGDVAGFIAAIYKRGLNFINIPTTLVAQVDSSLGGKTALNIGDRERNFKNQVGLIYHPDLILIDPQLLNSLDEKEFQSGLGEVIKYGLGFDKSLYESLFDRYDLENVIFRCLIIKAKITSQDEFDENVRLTLNFGHTIGHAIESISQFSISHGQAVALGMFYEVNDHNIKEELKTLFRKLKIDNSYLLEKEKIKDFIRQDKKIQNQQIIIPVLETVGKLKLEKKDLEDYLRGI